MNGWELGEDRLRTECIASNPKHKRKCERTISGLIAQVELSQLHGSTETGEDGKQKKKKTAAAGLIIRTAFCLSLVAIRAVLKKMIRYIGLSLRGAEVELYEAGACIGLAKPPWKMRLCSSCLAAT